MKVLDWDNLGVPGVRYFVVQDDVFLRLSTNWNLKTKEDRPDWEREVRDRRAQRWVHMIKRWRNEGM